MHEPFYSLKAVCTRTGLKPTTIHAWEKRYAAVTPQRTSTGHRVYTTADVEKLCMLIELKDFGHPIGKIAALSLSQLREIVSQKPDLAEVLPEFPYKKSRIGNRMAFCRRILDALDTYDLGRVHREIALARTRLETATFVLEALAPLFAIMNKKVNQGQLCVVREQAISAIIKADVLVEVMRLCYQQGQPPSIPRQRLLRVTLATMEGDDHEFGIMLAALLCAASGMLVTYLGSNVPAAALAEAIRTLRSDILIVSCPKQPLERGAQFAQDYLERLVSNLPKLCEIWIGGDGAEILAEFAAGHKTKALRTLHELHRHLQTRS